MCPASICRPRTKRPNRTGPLRTRRKIGHSRLPRTGTLSGRFLSSRSEYQYNPLVPRHIVPAPCRGNEPSYQPGPRGVIPRSGSIQRWPSCNCYQGVSPRPPQGYPQNLHIEPVLRRYQCLIRDHCRPVTHAFA